MRLQYMMLADKAEALNGKIYMLGGGLDTVRLLAIPALATYDVILAVAFTKSEAGEHVFELSQEDLSGKAIIGPIRSSMTAPEPTEGTESRVMLVVNGPFPVAQAGEFYWRLRVDDQELGSTMVRYQPSGLSAQQLEQVKVGGESMSSEGIGGNRPDSTPSASRRRQTKRRV